MVNPLKNLFKGLLKPKEKAIDDPDLLMSKVIYNTIDKFLVLITYGTNIFYPMIELLAQSGRAGIRIAVTNSAVVKEPEESEDEEFAKTPIKLVDNKHYALIAGSPGQYAELFKHVDLANPIMLELLQDIYQYCDSSIFSSLIDDGVLELRRFAHQNIEPQYDKSTIKWVNNGKELVLKNSDDIVYIYKNIPNVFDPYDVLRLLDACIAIHRRSYLITYQTIKKMCTPNDEVFLLLNHVLNEVGINVDELQLPIYKRIVKEYDDDGGPNMVGMNTNEIDSIFNQSYDRFNTPTADYMSQVDAVSVDEVLSEGDSEE